MRIKDWNYPIDEFFNLVYKLIDYGNYEAQEIFGRIEAIEDLKIELNRHLLKVSSGHDIQ